MASKRARSSSAVRPAFAARRPAEPEDDDRQCPGQQSRRGQADPAAQRAALAYARRLERDALACQFCYGEYDQADGRLTHDPACVLR